MPGPESAESVPTLRSPAQGALDVLSGALLSLLAGLISGQLVRAVLSELSADLGPLGFLVGLAVSVGMWRRLTSSRTIAPTAHLSHWSTMIENLSASPRDFYQQVSTALEKRDLPALGTRLVSAHEAGPVSAKRLYLEVRRGLHVFHICGAPFANGFFVSWWLGEARSPLVLLLASLPFSHQAFPWLFRLRTYYEVDTALMFQSLTHGAVLDVVDGLTKAKGVRGVPELERKPIMRDFFGS